MLRSFVIPLEKLFGPGLSKSNPFSGPIIGHCVNQIEPMETMICIHFGQIMMNSKYNPLSLLCDILQQWLQDRNMNI